MTRLGDAAPAPPFAGDWGAPPTRPRAVSLVVAPLAIALVLGAALARLASPALAGVVLAGGAAAVAAAAAVRPRSVLRRLRAAPADDPRLRNIVSGVASLMGRPAPSLYTAPDGMNAFALPGDGAGKLVVSAALLAATNRTELEAVAAASLARLSRSTWTLRVAAVLTPLGRLAGPLVDLDADVAAAAVTRYPPALVAAIERSDSPPPFAAPFAFVTFPPWGRPREERVALLLDL